MPKSCIRSTTKQSHISEERCVDFSTVKKTATSKDDEVIDVVNVDLLVAEPKKHKLQMKSKRKNKPKVKCVHCNYATRNCDHMNDHVVNFHLQLRTYRCKKCRVSAVSKKLLAKHVRSAHNKSADGSNASRQRTCQCGFTTTSFATFRRHFRFNHLQQFPWTCSLCSYVAATECNLQEHVAKNHEEISSFICGLCGYRAGSRAAVKVHTIRKHLTFFNAKQERYSKDK